MTAPSSPWLSAVWSRFATALREQRLAHGLLVAGDAGLGKRELVRAMVARLLCQMPNADDRACGQCRGCTWLAAGTHPDHLRIQPEEDSEVIKVAQIRELIERMQLTGQVGATRVAVIDPAEAMNPSAQNAVLKTLEEPPAGVHLILVADTPGRLLATVRSRCQRYHVACPDSATARAWLTRDGDAGSADALALAAGHPGLAQAYAEPARRQRVQMVAEDLCRLADRRASSLAVAMRWSADAGGHVDDAIAWLRLWSWRGHGVAAVATTAPAVSVLALAQAHEQALRLRERLRAPLKPVWLLHEWLVAWQGAPR